MIGRWRPGRPMSCRQVTRRLQTYLDGEADAATAEGIESHVEDCDHCGPEAAAYWEIKNALARQEPLDEAAMARLRRYGTGLTHHREDPAE